MLESCTLERLFGEAPGGFVVSGAEDAVCSLAASTPVVVVGSVGGDTLRIEVPARVRAEGEESGELLSLTLAELSHAHGALEELFA